MTKRGFREVVQVRKPVFEVVMELAESWEEGVTAAEVARATGRDRANVSRELNRLVRQGVLKKRPGRPVFFVPARGPNVQPPAGNGRLAGKGTGEHATGKRGTIPGGLTIAGTAFGDLVAAEGTLREACERGMAAVLYPPSGLHTLIIGPTGSGKSTFARAMHSFAVESGAWPPNAPFVSLNCSEYSQTPNLLLSQLFGHTKGAFTGAYADKVGLVERAASGMLFLDEVHRLPPQGQEMLFQIIDRGTYRRLGETGEERRANLMLVAATTEEPCSCLLHTFLRRIPVVITIPPLDEWKASERFALIQRFAAEEAAKFSRPVRVSPAALSRLMRASFPGNAGELKSRMQVACLRAFLSAPGRGAGEEIVVNGGDVPDERSGGPVGRGAADEDGSRDGLRGAKYRSSFQGEGERRTGVTGHPGEGGVMAGEDVVDLVEREIRSYVTDLYSRAGRLGDRSGFSGEELSGLCDPEVRDVLREVLPEMASRYSITPGPRALYALSVHITQRLKNRRREAAFPGVRSGAGPGSMMVMDVSGVDEKYIALARELASVLEERLGVRPLPGDVGIIARVLQGEVSGTERRSVAVVLALHGDGIAARTAALVRDILGDDLVVPLDLDLSWPLARKANAIASTLKLRRPLRGACVLTDMAFPGFVADQVAVESGMEVKIVGGASLPLILDIAARSLIPDISPAELVSRETTGYRSASATPGSRLCGVGDEGRCMLVTAGSRTAAERIRALLLEIFAEARDEGLSVLTLTPSWESFPDVVEEVRSYLAVVGTEHLGPGELTFVSLQDIVSGSGLGVLAQILEGSGYKVPSEPERRRRLLRKLTEDLLREQLTFLKPERLGASCLKVLEKVEDGVGVCYSTGACVRFMVHLACLVERMVLGQPVLEHPQARELFSAYSSLASVLWAVIKEVEEEFSCPIPAGEKAFLLEALTDTGSVQ